MTAYTRAYVRCDHTDWDKPLGQRRCTERVVEGHTRAEAREAARQAGWDVATARGGLDYCPQHRHPERVPSVTAAGESPVSTTWTPDPGGRTWHSKRGDVTLLVRRLGLDRWKPEVHRPGRRTSGPTYTGRAAAQRWAEREAGERR